MGRFKVNEREIFFILKEQLEYGALCGLERYRDLDESTLDMLVSEAVKFARGEVDPLQEIGEKWGVVFENGQVRCPPEFREAFRLFGENGWIAVARDPAYGGQGFPHMMRIVSVDQMFGAAPAFCYFGNLTHGAGHLIESFATEELKTLFVPKMYSGLWAGTMCLTEPNAGSNLAALQTTAFREGDHFRLKGSKQFITGGEQDLTENIIHLVLARIEGAPQGAKGISLFVVPKIRVNADGSLGEPNDIFCTAVEKKMGLHASPTCALSLGENDDCIGYLCGGENRGLAHMFQMVNQGRMNSALTGMSLAGAAYQNALDYTKSRIQGADLAGRKPGYVPIIDHPDVRRMLLWMKAAVEGMRSMIYTTAYWLDLALELPDGDEKSHYQDLVDFMTPILKGYCSETGFRVCETAVQCYGGYGYCKEYPVEQYLRDVKVTSIYEGTSGIQSMDLMGRKMQMNGGALFKAYEQEIEAFLKNNLDHPVLGKPIHDLSRAAGRAFEVAREMTGLRSSAPLKWASHTHAALRCFGDITIVWRLLDMARVALVAMDAGRESDFYRGKVMQATYYAGMTLPITMARLETCLDPGREVIDMPESAF